MTGTEKGTEKQMLSVVITIQTPGLLIQHFLPKRKIFLSKEIALALVYYVTKKSRQHLAFLFLFVSPNSWENQ